MIVSARPIIGSQMKGPIRGVLVIGRYLDKQVIDTITDKLNLNIDIISLGEERLKKSTDDMKLKGLKIISNEDSNFIVGHSHFPDIYGNPIVLLKLSMSRDITDQGKMTVKYGIGITILSGVVILIILMLILQRSIINPLSLLGRNILRLGKMENVLDALPVDRKDELGMIAKSVFVSHQARLLSESAFKKSKEEAEKANQSKSEFLARMSHELRTPLNAIMGFTQLLQLNAQSKLSDIEKKNLGLVFSAGNHLLELINEVLDLSRVESGSMELSIERVDIVPIVDNMISFSKSIADENFVSLEYQKIPEGSCFVEIDPLRFKQVLLNVMSNAIKYNKPNGSVIVSYEKQDNGMMRLGVRDTGHGIAEDMKDKLFEPFERFDVDAEFIEGTGIGLTITKQLIELMRGTIGFESTLGEGSYFYVEVPISDKVPLFQVEEKSESTQPYFTNNKKKILYIEDIPANVELVRQILNHMQGIRLLSASTALEGIRLAQSETPDLILMDIHLPEMDGLTAFKKLQTMNETKEIPVIALTADAMSVDTKKALDIGFKNYLTKPIDVQIFLDSIGTILK
jgi:signal transduction histidine kinase/CheY-like chemotaxis protein